MSNTYSIYKKTYNDSFERDLYKNIDIPFDDTDYDLYVDVKYEHKPGMLANDLYGTPRLAWVFKYFNKNTIEDYIWDLKSGMIIRVPNKERLLSYF